VAAKIGCQPETLRIWVRQAERNQGLRPGCQATPSFTH
jgi:transposase-like protein